MTYEIYCTITDEHGSRNGPTGYQFGSWEDASIYAHELKVKSPKNEYTVEVIFSEDAFNAA